MLRVVLIATLAGFVGAGLQMLVSGHFKFATDAGSPSVSADVPADNSLSQTPLPQERNTVEQKTEDLTVQLRQLQSAQLDLQRKMDKITISVASLQQRLEVFDDAREDEVLLDADNPDDESPIPANSISATNSVESSSGGPVRQRRLQQFEAAGVDSSVAEQLLTRLDQQQLAELDLRDEAARGGWLETAEYEERLQQLESSAPDLQSELGDDGYDRYLFAAGRANRVRVDSVITGSAAEQADVRRGDLIISYAGQQIFRINDLQEATRAGVRGEFVGLLLQRGQETLEQSVERGPLGITLSADRLDPDESTRP